MIKKKNPKFRHEDEERDFWAIHDSTEFIDWRRARRLTLKNLKTPTKTISVRLLASLLDDLKLLANKNDVPYQSLLKIFLAERLKQELAT